MENDFGKKIKEIRKSRGLTQQEFADSLGYAHKSTINKIESGQEDMSYQKLMLLLKTYDLDANELFGARQENLKHNSCIVYIHGLYGSAKEAKLYSFLSNKYDVIGLDYEDGDPWKVYTHIISEFEKITKNYEHVNVIATSIGAFYAFTYLYKYNIEKAFFISPLTNMKAVTEGMMKKNNITLEQLKNERFIKIETGEVLSYDFYEFLRKKDHWEVKTNIVYGEKDKMVDKASVLRFVTNHDASIAIMKNGNHYFHSTSEIRFIRKWINEYF